MGCGLSEPEIFKRGRRRSFVDGQIIQVTME